MSILKMERINIYALRKYRKGILEELQRRGVVQVEDLSLEDSAFYKEKTSQKQAVFMKNSAVAENALSILNSYVPEKSSMLSMFKGRDPITVENYYLNIEDREKVMSTAYSIISYEKNIADNKAEIIRLSSQIDTLLPWKDFDISMRFKGTGFTKAFVGSLPQNLDYEAVTSQIAEKTPALTDYNLEIVSCDDNQTCIFMLCAISQAEIAEDALRHMGFTKPAYLSKVPPMERIQYLKEKIDICNKAIDENAELIKSLENQRESLKFMSDYFVMRAEKYQVIENLALTKRTFILSGYIPKEQSEKVNKILSEKYEAFVEFEVPDENEDVPIALKNNSFSAPVESVLETYSLPNRGEVDPTSIMAIFYYVFFGMMFSDAGYGIVMTLACAIVLKKFKNMESRLKKSVKMFMFCGISTAFWGFMFGSFFGNAVSVIGDVFFGADVSIQPIWFNPIEGSNAMTLLMVCFLFGIIHLFTGLAIKAFMLIRDKKYLDAVYDVLSWYLLVGGGILALLSVDMLSSMTGFVLPPIFLTVGGICAGLGALIIIFFEGRGSKPIKRFFKGLYGVYGVTSYLSDILSYSRLLALGLATGVIAQVFNQIASMFGGGIGIIPFAIIFIIGHSLNIGINALGAYVHTNRLQFVEFFGKFYEGGGRKFTPFKINTKHFKIKEENYNE